jgi:serine/threonine protein kinase
MNQDNHGSPVPRPVERQSRGAALLETPRANQEDSATNPIRLGARLGNGSSPSIEFPFLLPPVEPDEIGRLGNYRVLRLLGMGGMAYVFLAEDIALRRRVALKVLKPDLDSDLGAWQRFLREARIMAAIKHEHIVTVYQVAQEDRLIFLAMELLDGETLEDWSQRTGPAQPRDLVRLGRQIAAGLAELHRRGLVHRDVKPGNLWLEKVSGGVVSAECSQPIGHHSLLTTHHSPRVKILDLGLARQVNDNAQLTLKGLILGTPAFMSPEQARGSALDFRSDLFSLGSVLYRLATGTLPFEAENTMTLLTAVASQEPRPVAERNPALPPPLAALVMKLLAKKPDERPVSATAVIEELEQLECQLAGPTAPVPCARPRSTPQLPAPRSTNGWRYALPLALAMFAMIAIVALLGLAVVGTLVFTSLAAARVDQPDPNAVFLSDLQPVESFNWLKHPPYPPGEFKKKGPPPICCGVTVHGNPLPRGIFMHPPTTPTGGVSRLGYSLDGKFESFDAEVSLNDGPARSDTPLTFSVIGDGERLWESRPVSSQLDAQACSISVKDVQVLAIQVDCPGFPGGAHAVWIDPRLRK